MLRTGVEGNLSDLRLERGRGGIGAWSEGGCRCAGVDWNPLRLAFAARERRRHGIATSSSRSKMSCICSGKVVVAPRCHIVPCLWHGRVLPRRHVISGLWRGKGHLASEWRALADLRFERGRDCLHIGLGMNPLRLEFEAREGGVVTSE
jgi:hypothetical protein